MSKRVLLVRCALLSTVAMFGSGCSTLEGLKTIGNPPPLSPVSDPTTQPGYTPVQMPMPTPTPATFNPNSLWRNGSRAFFKDQRAHQVGDILTVKVNLNDTAEFQDQTNVQRSATEDSALTGFLGSNTITSTRAPLPGTLLNTNSNTQSDATGSINRQDQLVTNVAGVVTQLLPNGNMVIEGKQEVRLNSEMRELLVAGVVRPEDIESDNTIDLSKIAEARLAYGGKGTLTNVQQPPWAQQAAEIILPF
jgi:flagellar L-ring protein precursor FlgH